MAYMRVDNKNGKQYIRIVASKRKKGKPTQETVYSLGKVSDYTPTQLRRFGYVNCNQRFPGGNWLIQCKDLIIFDEDLREMNLLQLIELSEKYWYLSDKAEG